MEDMKKVGNSSCNDVLLRMGLNDNKAGMQGLDKEKINKIIMEATKGSRFYENEVKKDQQVNQRIEKMMQLKEKITTQQLLKAQLQITISPLSKAVLVYAPSISTEVTSLLA
ncbi:DNA polymerase kappa [Grus japonensis]|uniref:DNA polymerase kappa n=1 Tax=Grus japonensis TaxID=30415 RepID=A0ABC9Y3Y0_GRUJA